MIIPFAVLITYKMFSDNGGNRFFDNMMLPVTGYIFSFPTYLLDMQKIYRSEKWCLVELFLFCKAVVLLPPLL
jgi:hypothetical protein